MRALTAGYLSHLTQIVQQRALLVKITRQDGQIFGFTTFDDELVFDGVTYEAFAAMEASDLRSTAGTGVDNVEAMGALMSNRITDTDVLAGLWDQADVLLSECVWSDLALGDLTYLKGSLGEWTLETGRYRTELRSLAQRLAQQIVELYQPTCRVARLFDSRCYVRGVNYDETNTPADFRSTHTVASVGSVTEITFAANSQATGYYRHGRVAFTTGANAGIEREIKEHTLSGGQAVVTLQEAFPFTVTAGDSALLEAGCDRRLTTCVSRFANAGNFRGEPHLPGTDALLVRGRR